VDGPPAAGHRPGSAAIFAIKFGESVGGQQDSEAGTRAGGRIFIVNEILIIT
jgi:hypothetical protein